MRRSNAMYRLPASGGTASVRPDDLVQVRGDPSMSPMILKYRCQDRPGLVAAVSNLVFTLKGNITEATQFDDQMTRTFFLRMAFSTSVPEANLRQDLARLASEHGAAFEIKPADRKRKVLILVSRFDHCLGDLLYRMRIGELNMECVGVVANHPREAMKSTSHIGLPFHHLPTTPDSKKQQEAEIKKIIDETGAELVILARYMQILSDEFAADLSGRCINIHHSFLPGFKGAKPYHQAHARGVKMIGATAHYVTGDLDEGPIIAQDVEQINHADTPDDMVRKGRDIERRVLARAVLLHLEDRVFVNGNKTVVFT